MKQERQVSKPQNRCVKEHRNLPTINNGSELSKRWETTCRKGLWNRTKSFDFLLQTTCNKLYFYSMYPNIRREVLLPNSSSLFFRGVPKTISRMLCMFLYSASKKKWIWLPKTTHIAILSMHFFQVMLTRNSCAVGMRNRNARTNKGAWTPRLANLYVDQYE